MDSLKVRKAVSRAVVLLALGFVVLFCLASLYSLVISVVRQEQARLEPAQPIVTSYVITAVVIGPQTPTVLPVPTVTATATPTLHLVPMATATPPPEPTVIVTPAPRVPTVTPLPPKLEGLGGLIQGLFGSWLYKAVKGK
jgi:hypothetical protein